MEEHRLLDSIMTLLPTETAARAMQRLALHAHLPPIRSRIPQTSKPFSRSKQQHPGGLFGPKPTAGKALLFPQASHRSRPASPLASPRLASSPRHLASPSHLTSQETVAPPMMSPRLQPAPLRASALERRLNERAPRRA